VGVGEVLSVGAQLEPIFPSGAERVSPPGPEAEEVLGNNDGKIGSSCAPTLSTSPTPTSRFRARDRTSILVPGRASICSGWRRKATTLEGFSRETVRMGSPACTVSPVQRCTMLTTPSNGATRSIGISWASIRSSARDSTSMEASVEEDSCPSGRPAAICWRLEPTWLTSTSSSCTAASSIAASLREMSRSSWLNTGSAPEAPGVGTPERSFSRRANSSCR
jgi:hypothetical protein